MVLDKDLTYKNLKNKGFTDAPNRSKDHKRLEFRYENKVIVMTKVSHCSDKDLGDYLIKQMSTQCKLTKSDFIDLAKCPLSKEEYLQKLKDCGIIK